jgi:GxxExxY protein
MGIVNEIIEKGDPETYAIIGAAMEVHRVLGSGFLEAVYQEAMAREMGSRGIPFKAQLELPIFYKGEKLPTCYKADFICFDSVLVELKAMRAMTTVEDAQVINYLKATGLLKGLLFNFHGQSLEHKRFANQKKSA